MAFTATSESSDGLKAIITAISTLVEEATFVANAEGITFRGMDPSHVALIDISWPNSAFKEYECDSDIKFGVRIDEFSKLIKRAGRKESVCISITEKDMLLVTIGANKRYRMRLIESSAINTPLPKSLYETKLEMPIGVFEKVLGDIHVVSNHLTMISTESGVTFSGKGDTGDVSIEIAKDDGDLIKSLKVKEKSTGTYNMDYLNPIVKAVSSAADTVTCEYAGARPLRIEFKISNIGRIHFYLAPRVEN